MYKTHIAHYSKFSKTTSDSSSQEGNDTPLIIFLVVLHIGLALLIRRFSILSTIHALIILFLGFWNAISTKNITNVIPYVAYITGAEVLWRMTDAQVFYEFGKYATVALLFITLLKKSKLKRTGLPIFFFLLLIPSIVLTVNALGFTEHARQMISFNLSGPLAVSVCLLFFSQVDADQQLLRKWIWATVYPIISVLAIAAYSTLTTTDINFGSESVFVTSGGFGPNQVSAVLGLGALLLVMLIIQSGRKGRLLSIFLSLALLTQSFLTFSRGGIYNFVVGLAVGLIILVQKPSKFVRSFFFVFLILLIVGVFIFPNLEELTSGAFSSRFKDIDTSSRINLAKADLELFKENLIFGVGPGMASYMRQNIRYTSAHTEYSRLLAEHGILGILSLIFLIYLLVAAFFRTPDIFSRAWMVALAAWPLVEMAHSAMRIAAIAFILGLSVVNWKTYPNYENNEIVQTPY